MSDGIAQSPSEEDSFSVPTLISTPSPIKPEAIPMNDDRDLHVVLGTGPSRTAVARTLAARNRRVRMVNRTGTGSVPDGARLQAADVADPDQARTACNDASVVYHCMATAYTDWPATLPPLVKGAIEGASAAGARLVYDDNLYMYGPVDAP